MRIRADPGILGSYGPTLADLKAAINTRNMGSPLANLAAHPYATGQWLNATIIAQSQLPTPEDFRNIFLRVNPNGSFLRP